MDARNKGGDPIGVASERAQGGKRGERREEQEATTVSETRRIKRGIEKASAS